MCDGETNASAPETQVCVGTDFKHKHPESYNTSDDEGFMPREEEPQTSVGPMPCGQGIRVVLWSAVDLFWIARKLPRHAADMSEMGVPQLQAWNPGNIDQGGLHIEQLARLGG